MKTKRELMAEVYKYAHSDPHTSFVLLLHACIKELRLKNDTATPEDCLKHQGAISELKSILKGVTVFEKYEEYSGGFDE